MKQYNVALKADIDYNGFWNDMESETDGLLYIPNRRVEFTNERPASLRQCWYLLTDEEAEEGKELLGFIAQEVQTVIPQAVESFSNNSLNISGSIIESPLRVNEKFLIPVLTKAIQEQQTIIDGLLARIEALENR